MRDPNRLTADEFFGWQALVDGRYELIDGHITPHPDYVTPLGFAAPDNDHAAVCATLIGMLQMQLRAPCRVYVGAGTIVDRVNANVPDIAVSCSESDRAEKALAGPRLILEVSSTKTARIDTGRKVDDYLAIATVESYVVVDRSRRAITVYAPDRGPQTYTAGVIDIARAIALDVEAIFA